MKSFIFLFIAISAITVFIWPIWSNPQRQLAQSYSERDMPQPQDKIIILNREKFINAELDTIQEQRDFNQDHFRSDGR